MSLLKDAIKKGISQSVSKAVEEAAKNVVAPAVNKLAEGAKEKIGEVAAEVGKNVDEVRAGLAEANEGMKQANEAMNNAEAEAAAQNVDLGALFGNFVNNATSFANNMAANLKECPKCGEVVPVDCEFCPTCGTKLAAGSLADDCKCSVCGEVNLTGKTFCAKCGGKLVGAIKNEQKVAETWNQNLSAYPMWCCGGTDYDVEENGENNGYPVWLFTARNTEPEAGAQYLKVCQNEGFLTPTDCKAVKEVNGVNYAVSIQDCYDDGITSVYFYVEENTPAKEEKKQSLSNLINDNKETIDKAAEAAKDVANGAKKLLSGFFKK